VLLGEGVERAVGEHDLAVPQMGFVAVVLERADDRSAALGAARPPPHGDAGGFTDTPPRVGGGPAQGRRHRHGVAGRALDRLGEQPTGKVVATLR
jgi:hypothetical protein